MPQERLNNHPHESNGRLNCWLAEWHEASCGIAWQSRSGSHLTLLCGGANAQDLVVQRWQAIAADVRHFPTVIADDVALQGWSPSGYSQSCNDATAATLSLIFLLLRRGRSDYPFQPLVDKVHFQSVANSPDISLVGLKYLPTLAASAHRRGFPVVDQETRSRLVCQLVHYDESPSSLCHRQNYRQRAHAASYRNAHLKR